MSLWACLSCDYLYIPEQGEPGQGIAPGTPFAQLPHRFKCPKCHAPRDDFEEQLSDFQEDPDLDPGEELDEDEPDAFAPGDAETDLQDDDESLPEELSEEELVMLHGIDPFSETLSGDPDDDVDEDGYDEAAAFADLTPPESSSAETDPEDDESSNPILELEDLSGSQGESLTDDLTEDDEADAEDPSLAQELGTLEDFEAGVDEDVDTDAFADPGTHSQPQQGVCSRCDFTYDPAQGCIEQGYDPGTAFDELLDDFTCPGCGAALADFRLVTPPASSPLESPTVPLTEPPTVPLTVPESAPDSSPPHDRQEEE